MGNSMVSHDYFLSITTKSPTNTNEPESSTDQTPRLPPNDRQSKIEGIEKKSKFRPPGFDD